MKPLHEQELDDARQKLAVNGRAAEDFTFDVSFMEPDPDGAGMYTVRYEVSVSNGATGKSGTYFGGIGSRWVDAFEEDLKDGQYD